MALKDEAPKRPLIVTGDCRSDLEYYAPFDMLIADPPYGETKFAWDKRCSGWLGAARAMLKPTGSLWVFGSMRLFIDTGGEFASAGFRYREDIVWEKHNGSNMRSDNAVRRVHEIAVRFYRTDAPWAAVWNEAQKTPDAVARTVRRKKRPNHFGNVNASSYVSVDGGPRFARSVIFMPSCHGRAIHPTEKPVALLELLVRSSCPPGGVIGNMFAGSGAAGEAARLAGRWYVGCELDPAMADRARHRLSSY